MDPEYSILKHRMDKIVVREALKLQDLDLVSLTKVAERAITEVRFLLPPSAHFVILATSRSLLTLCTFTRTLRH